MSNFNAEDIFSAPKNIDGDHQHRLGDISAYSILNINTIDNSGFELDILEDFETVPLLTVLGYNNDL